MLTNPYLIALIVWMVFRLGVNFAAFWNAQASDKNLADFVGRAFSNGAILLLAYLASRP